ncbi:hypothetical protein HNV11_21905 [Spirosoma taeanense]|uniref:Uncharacterized protein n=1 Tax=Spirosoma taeanense TaxID=2735870 RepID=A0A6M5YCP8_9BACT|nr:hypothetical protein [Spirosoma taeanense]QJW91845.1 hypothetical protein HNV11_21905 [Spirosoma taeanense]
MEQNKQETRVVFWRNLAIHRYMAIAACLVVVCLFGWLYWPSTNTALPGNSQVAGAKGPAGLSNKDDGRSSKQEVVASAKETRISAGEQARSLPVDQGTEGGQLARAEKPAMTKSARSWRQPSAKPVFALDEAALAQTKVVETRANPAGIPADLGKPTATPAQEQLASKPGPSSERVLIVTIAEPEALVAARQAAKMAVEEKMVAAVDNKPEKESRAGTIWQQVKRIKQGEILARHDNDDDRGLLGRAYNGLKHSLDKDKPTKQ